MIANKVVICYYLNELTVMFANSIDLIDWNVYDCMISNVEKNISLENYEY